MQIVSPESMNMSSSRLGYIRNVMDSQVQQKLFAGISTLVARKGKIVHFEQFGFSDREANTPLHNDTLFRIYSMTKPIICTAFMCLYEQGKFDLNEPVSKYIPAFNQLKVLEKNERGENQLVALQQPITIHHLLTHTAGFVYDIYEDQPVSALYRKHRISTDTCGVSLEAFVDNICKLPLAFQPGTQWYYSISIDIVARLIEIIANQSLDEFLRERIFNPLGMTDTSFYVPEDKRYRLAAMYGALAWGGENVTWSGVMDHWEKGVEKRLDVSTTCPIDEPSFGRGGIGLVSTVKDYWRFAQMLLNQGHLEGNRILGPKTVEFMHLNHLPEKLLPIGFADFKLGSLWIPGSYATNS